MTDKGSQADYGSDDGPVDATADSSVFPKSPIREAIAQVDASFSETAAVSMSTSDLAAFNTIPATLAAVMADVMPKLHQSSMLPDLNFMPANFAAVMADVMPKLHQSSMLPDLNFMPANFAAVMADVMPKLHQSSMLPDLNFMPANFAAVMADVMPKLHQSSMLPDLNFMPANFAAVMADVMPKLHQSSMLPDLNFMPAGLTATMAAATNARLLALEHGFLKGSGTAADFFGELDTAIAADHELNQRLRRAVATTQRAGSFGLDYKSLERGAANLADRFVDEPDLERHVRAALEPVQELTGLADERLIDLGEQLGWWKRITHHKLSTAGIILGYTMGLVTYIAGADPGMTAAPSVIVEAIVFGGGIYTAIHRIENDESKSLE